jgi:hypothetical protein
MKELYSFCPPNRGVNFYDPTVIQELKEGKLRLVIQQGGVLNAVPLDYKLKMWETFVSIAED